MDKICTSRVRRLIGAVLAIAMLAPAAIVTSVVVLPGSVAEAARQAPTYPLPECVISNVGVRGLGCLPGDAGGWIDGSFEAGGEFTVVTEPNGLGPCATYVSTDCYYDVYDPIFSACVYLANNNPRDVRNCPPLSTQNLFRDFPNVFPQRVGTCRGTLGSQFTQGGTPPWNVRAYTVASCKHVLSPANRPIDNLLGPTFMLVRTSVLKCIQPTPNGCDEPQSITERINEYRWLPVKGTLAPHAAFDAASTTPGSWRFTNRSEPFATGVTTWEWTFGDGGTATTASPTHTYALPGKYTVTLTMRNSANATRSVSRVIDVKAPTLQVAVYDPNAVYGPNGIGTRYSIDDVFTARVVVSTDLGLGVLADVAPVGGLVAVPPQLEMIGAPQVISPFTLASNDQRIYDVQFRAIAPGTFLLTSTWNGTDMAGRDAGPKEGSLNGSASGIKAEVTVTPKSIDVGDDNNGDGVITPRDDEITVTVKVTNVSNGPITRLTYDGLDLSSNILDDPSVRLDPVSAPTRGFNDLPAKGATDELVWVYRATDSVDARAQIIVTGTGSGFETRAEGVGDIRAFTLKLIEASITLDNQAYTSGKLVRISGSFKNVTDPDGTDGPDKGHNVSFAVARTFTGLTGEAQGNGGNGFFSRPGSATAQGISMYEVAPNDTIELDAIVETIESPDSSGFVVEYAIFPFVPDEVDPTKYVPGDQRNVEILEEGGSAPEHRVTLAPVVPVAEAQGFINCFQDVIAYAYFGCKFAAGVETALRGLWDIALLAHAGSRAILQAKTWMFKQTIAFLRSDPAARLLMIREIVKEMVELKRLGNEALQTLTEENIRDAVTGMVKNTIGKAETLLATGDLKLITGELFELGGENVDMVLEGLVAARTIVKATAALGGRTGLLRTAVRDGIEANADTAIREAEELITRQGAEALPDSRVLRGGIDVTTRPRIWKAFGVTSDDLKALFEIAKDNGVQIIFRSRSPKSGELIKTRRALPKPQGVQTKGVNRLDIDFLGYPQEYDALVVVVEPPIAYHPPGTDRDNAIAAFIDGNEKFNEVADGPGKDDLRNALTERLQTRLKEWEGFAIKVDGNQRAIWETEGIKIDFDPEKNGFGREFVPGQANVNSKIEPADFGDRKAWKIKMEHPDGVVGPDGSTFYDITGDIDFLGILTPDGRVLGDTADPIQRAAELAQRAEIYEQMRALVGMQHGESFTLANPDHRAKFVGQGVDGEGGETLLAATPQGRLITTYFDDALSTLKGGPNGQLVDGVQRSVFDGLLNEGKSPPRDLNLITLSKLQEFYGSWDNVTNVFSASVLARLVSALSDGDVDPEYARDGDRVQPTPNGGLEQYEPGPGGNATGAGSRLSVPAMLELEAAELAAPLVDPLLASLIANGFRPPAAIGRSGGRWVAVSPATLTAAGPVSLAPMAFFSTDVDAGTVRPPVLSLEQMNMPATSAYFQTGDRVAVDPGGADEEYATIASIAPLTFASPLERNHEPGTMVLALLDTEFGIVPTPPSGGSDGSGSGSGSGVTTPGTGGSTASAISIVPVVPARLFDTRPAATVDAQQSNVGRRTAASTTEVQVGGRGNVPADAIAANVNVVAINPGAAGFFTIYPCGSARPEASTLNFAAGQTIANGATITLGTAGKICVFSDQATDLILDVTGYIPAGSTVGSVQPARLHDTRPAATVDGQESNTGRRAAGSTTTIQVGGRGNVPATALAATVNVVAINPGAAGFFTIYPCGSARPEASTLNFAAGQTIANGATIKLGTGGSVCVYSDQATDLILDVTGYVPAGSNLGTIVPARLFDTRPSATIDGQQSNTGRRTAASTTEVIVGGRGNVPANASGAMVNVVAIDAGAPGFLTLYPCGSPRPEASTLNYATGQTIANGATIKLGTAGTICVYTDQATDLLFDVTGFVPAA